MERTSKIWLWATICGIAAILTLIALAVWTVDPYFVFRAPQPDRFRYILDNGRCQNPGIMKSFDFDMMVVGSSMTENFKASELSKAFGRCCVKLPYNGGSYREYCEAVLYANAVNTNLQLTIVCLDLNKVLLKPDWLPGKAGRGLEFARSANPIVKLEYLFYPDAVGKTFRALFHASDPGITSFDDYGYWGYEDQPCGKAVVIGHRPYVPALGEQKPFADADQKIVGENLARNILPMIASSRRIIFFFSPYSIFQWHLWRLAGEEKRFLTAERQYIAEIVKHPNARIFAWNDRLSLVGDLKNYVDGGHYVAAVNAQMVAWMREGVGEITESSMDGYFQREERLIKEFDYETLFK